ncbi:MAG: sulfotransferase domain-containing protein [Candidatus Aminicenantes bacterium]|nr:sulfotransferase domain-containing protein [Candidatus Aminicenantes bacterium]
MNSKVKKVTSKLSRSVKFIYLFLKKRTRAEKKILFILGCQRSGTSLLERIFIKDWNTRVYKESSILSSKDKHKLRLNDLNDVRNIINNSNADMTAAKPLVESQNAIKLLDFSPAAKILWVYRHYKDVASSNLKAFGLHNGIKDLRFIAEKKNGDWRFENISADTREIVGKYFNLNMNPYDAAALFWLVRNRLFFEQQLHLNNRAKLINYDDLCNFPGKVLESVYEFMEKPFPGTKLVREVTAKSVAKGAHINLSGEVERLCRSLFNRLKKYDDQL